MTEHTDVAVIGGGPAGSVTAREIAAAGYAVTLLEKRTFPRETLCGEFLSREVVGILRELGLEEEFHALLPNPITTFTLLPGSDAPLRSPLGFTAYGVKRGKLDAMLLEAARAEGAAILQPAEVTEVERTHKGFIVRFTFAGQVRTLQSSWVVGAYGKSSPLDGRLGRSFAGRRTGFTGVKFHVPARLLGEIHREEITIALGVRMYCGINHVSEDTATICFLAEQRPGDSPARERLRELASENPHVARIVGPDVLDYLQEASIYGTGNLFLGARNLVESGIPMVGDAAGMIAPLAGDGIGIALQQGRLLGRLLAERVGSPSSSDALYEKYWRESLRLFACRKWFALTSQRLLLSRTARPLVTPLLSSIPGLLRGAIHATRGNAL